jgi:hypothetical protein
MSNWDFGYGREQADPRDRRYPPPPAGGEGYRADDHDPYDPRAAPYPLTYERDVFDGRPTWSTGSQQAGPGRAPRPTSPGRAVPPRPGPPPAAPWHTGPQSAATQRLTPPPWAPVPPPAGPFGGDQYASGQYASGQYAGGQHAGGQHAGGQYGDPSGGAGHLGGQAGYTGPRHGFAGSWDRADPTRSMYPDGQAGQEPWLDDARRPRRDGPWWDPDSWPDWRRWLIPLGVAVLAAAIGAALVLLTGTHPGVSAAVGQASTTTPARPAAF